MVLAEWCGLAGAGPAAPQMVESAEAATEPLLATPPRAAAQSEDAGPGRTNEQARSNESSQGEQENRDGGPVDSNGEARPAKLRPPLPRPEGTVNCPRCTSVDTKFCYYNNYNVKQPRYFCKVSRGNPLVCRNILMQDSRTTSAWSLCG